MARASSQFMLTDGRMLAAQFATINKGECPYTLLIGAGASVSSGIPQASELIETWKKEIFSSMSNDYFHSDVSSTTDTEAAKKYDEVLEKYNEWACKDNNSDSGYKVFFEKIQAELDSTTQYSALFQYTRKTRSERQMYIESLIDRKIPGPGYFFLSGLIEHNYIDRILTTNFDDMLEDAIRRYYNRTPIVCSFDSAVDSMNMGSIRPKIVKLHGDYLFDNIKNTDEERTNLSSNMEEKFIQMCEDRGLVVVGYSGNDQSIMAIIQENMRKNRKFLSKGLHWCHYCPTRNKDDNKSENATRQQSISGSFLKYVSRDEIPAKLAEVAERFRDRVFIYGIDSFDNFFHSIYIKLNIPFPDVVKYPLQKNPARDLLKAIRLLQRDTIEITPQMTDCRQRVLDGLSKAVIDGEIDMGRAQQLWSKINVEKKRVEEKVRKQKNSTGANNKIDEIEFSKLLDYTNQSIEITQKIYNNNSEPLRIQLEARARMIACVQILSEIDYHLGRDWKINMEKAFSLAHEIEDLLPRCDGKNDERWTYDEVLYNAICTIGEYIKFCGFTDNRPEISKLDLYCKILISTQNGRRQIKMLTEDEDVQSIRDIIEKYDTE